MTTQKPRNVWQLTEMLSFALQRLFPSALGMALGGSHGNSRHDDQSDLDLVLVLPEGPLMEQARHVHETVLPLLKESVQIAGGPTWKEGFGCRSSVLCEDGFKVEVFVVTPDTMPITERVLQWRILWGAGRLEPLRAAVARQLRANRAIASAQFDVAYANLSVCRHLARGEVFAARQVLTSLVAIALALRLFQLGRGYDPAVSTKRIARDGLMADPLVLHIGEASAGLGGDPAQLARVLRRLREQCWSMLHALPALSEAAWSAQQAVEALATAPDAWLPAWDPPSSEVDAPHHLLQGNGFR